MSTSSSSAPGYEAILEQIRLLTPDKQLALLTDIAALLRDHVASELPRRSLLELQGLGKQAWDGIDAQEYVNRERDAWNG